MKKLMAGLLFSGILVLSACGNEDAKEVDDTGKSVEEVSETPSVEETTNEPTQEELNAQLKEEATKADIVDINVENPPIGKKVYVDGEVSSLIEGALDDFVITSKENSGYGMYRVQLANTTDAEYKDGDIVRVYGSVIDKDESGTPQISATIIEKVEEKTQE